MKKICLTMVVVVVLSMVVTSGQVATTSDYDYEADQLKEIGVFKGTDQGYELDRQPTRLEGAVMFVRLLGAEERALMEKNNHPFRDVAAWGDDYVGYLYQRGLTSGVSDKEFGASSPLDGKSYLTFMLRALGYDDSQGDFAWQEAVEKSHGLGLIDDALKAKLEGQIFLRDHVAGISYRALKQKLKSGQVSLAGQLVSQGAFTHGLGVSMGVLEEENKLFSEGTPLVGLKEADIIALGAGGFAGSDLEVANQIKDWQVDHMTYAASSDTYRDVSYSMRWNYAFPGLYTSKDMIDHMKDGDKIYGICYNYGLIFAEIAHYYGLEVRLTNTSVKPSEVSENKFYKATATGLGLDEYAAFQKWILKKGLNKEDYPYEAVRLVMAETALHYRAEVYIDDQWVPLDTYRSENAEAKVYTFVETNWQEGHQVDQYAEYVSRLKRGEDLKGDEDLYQTYKGFLQGMLIRIEQDELKDYVGITDDLGQEKRAKSQDDLLQGYGLAPYFNEDKAILDYMGHLPWLADEIQEYMAIKEALEAEADLKFYVIVDLMLGQEDDSVLAYEVYLDQYLGYTGLDISQSLTEALYKKYIQ